MKRPRRESRPIAAAAPKVVRIEKPIYGGAFLARMEGKATFVPLTLPGEEASVRIVEEKRSYASAEPQEIVTPAPERVAPGCRHFGTCGGCNYQHANYEAQLEFKKAILRESLERGGVQTVESVEVLAGNPWQYRNRIRLGFDSAGRMGYRGRRSHQIVPIAECPIAAPLLVNAALSAAEILRSLKPALRPTEISLFCNRDETALLASVFLQELPRGVADRFARAWRERVAQLTGVEFVVENGAGKISQSVARWGDDSLTYCVKGIDYRVDHGAFFQVNRWLLDDLVDRVAANRQGGTAWDLFAGVGLFARKIAERFEQVIAVESAPAALGALASNLSRTSGECVNADTQSFLKQRSKSPSPDLIVVDPPRTGLGNETASLLAQVAAKSIVYVSCDPATLARDLRVLIDAGYSLISVTLADLFPQTFHLETVVELQRS
jgi:23S rRNA (uracil1939-C5)-methyltransferase